MALKLNSILMVHPFGIGDVLFMTPLIHALKTQGVNHIDLVLGSRTQTIFENHPGIREIHVIDRDRLASQSWLKNFKEITSLLGRLRRHRYDAFIDLSLGRQYSFLTWLCLNIPVRIGFDYKNRGIFLNRKLKLQGGFREKSVVEYYSDLLKLIDINLAEKELEFYVQPQDEKEAELFLKQMQLDVSSRLLAVAPGGGESWGKDARLKQWPLSHFHALIKQLQTKKYLNGIDRVLILGSKNDKALGEALRTCDPSFYVNGCAQTSLRVTAAILKKVTCLIANDGGLVHLACAVKTPVMAIFGPVDPRVYGPYPILPTRIALVNENGPECRPCYQNMRYNSACMHIECLNGLSAIQVIQQAEEKGFFQAFRQKVHS